MVFDLSNLPYWIFLGTGLVLFVVSISAGGEDALEGEAEVGFFTELLFGWLGIGSVPFVLLLAADLSLWGILGWMANVLLGVKDGAASGLIFIASGVVGVLLGGAIARPIGKIFFAPFSEDASSDRLIGCLGTVSAAQIPRMESGKVGQVDLIDAAKNLVTVNAVIPNDARVMPQRGDRVIAIEQCDDFFVVIADGSIDRDRWLGTVRR
jgi:hypothetical protein